jgi:hypothetical protein
VSFKGFERPFEIREVALIETVVLDSYNLLTRGHNKNVTGCIDEYCREMQNSTMIIHEFEAERGEEPSTLDMKFDTVIICNGCPENVPLFGTDSSTDGRSLQEIDRNREIFDLEHRRVSSIVNPGHLILIKSENLSSMICLDMDKEPQFLRP